MRKKVFLVLALGFAPCIAWANTPGQFLKSGFGARAVGLGGAYSVVTDDPGSLYWNPAGLAQISGEKLIVRELDINKEAETAFEEKSEFDDLMDEFEGDEGSSPRESLPNLERVERVTQFQMYGAYSHNALKRQNIFTGAGISALGGGIGVGFLGAQSQSIDAYDTAGNSLGAKKYSSFAGFLGYGREIGSLRFGVSGMGIHENIGGASLNGGGLNVGVQVVPIPILSAGASIQNLAGFIQESTTNSSKLQKLDTILNVSIALTTPPPNSDLKILLGLTTNLDQPKTEGMQMNLGVAYSLNSFSYLMAGLNGGDPSLGMGLMFKNFKFAYALNTDALSLAMQHSVEANFIF